MYSIKSNRLCHLHDLLFFLKSLIAVYMLCVFKYLFRVLPDSFFEIIPSELKYCKIESYEFDSESETESGLEIGTELKQSSCSHDMEIQFLSFMLNINLNKLNKYKCSNGRGVYYIRTAFVFRNNNGRLCGVVPVHKKLALWSRIFSKDKLYINDILNLAGVCMDSSHKASRDYYMFMIVEEVESGYSYKVVANLTSKKYIPDYSDIMFSKLCINIK